ncbi:MAG: TonB-dependent receptor, partial [Bacteroidales bacterium]|nr:TonB-dependent receptor [Bacteroidales bacterium]
MIRYVSLWLIMGIALHSFTQTVTISAKGSGEVLESVEIYSLRPPHSTITDANGRADVSAFADADSIYIRRVGFKTILTTYANLQALHFKVQLATSEVLLDEVVISSYQEDPGQQTSLHIEPLHLKTIEQSGSFGISNALATMPGISELSSGIGISKPVIRGLYGNRVLVLLSGLRFDNQQWQDEHGLGLPGFGISRIEVIKGPLSILYGTEAVGGVINIIEEHPPPPETYEADAGVEFHSNTLGGTLQGGVKAAHNKHWFRLRLGAISHCDYSDGNNERVLNSRYNGYLLKTGYGYKHNKWQSENHYYFSYHQFGFIFNGISDFFEPDNRWSRNMSGPHHRVLLNMFTSANTYHLKSSELRLNAGFQSNLRSEDEGGGKLSLIMHLMTAQYSLKWEKPLSENLSLVIANNTSLENNANYGKRKIVPDARLLESNVSVYLKHSYEKLIIEYGAGAGGKYIHTLLTKTVNSGEKEVDPFEQFRTFYNGMLGVSYIPQHRLNIKLNVASGVRAPNLAELSSNGLHEGIYTFEIGDPDLEN